MINLCLIGDSHLAALKFAWPLIEDSYPDIRIDFFGAGFRRMQHLEVRDGMLVASEPGLARALNRSSGKEEAQIGGGYDAYLVYGLALRIYHARPLYSAFRSERHHEDSRVPLSDDCFLRAMTGVVRETPAAGVLTKVRQITTGPTLLLATPMVAKADQESHTAKFLADQGVTADYFALACTNFAAALGCKFEPQLPETLAAPLRTHAHHALGPARFSFDDAEPDGNHLNPEYGTLVLHHVLPLLRSQVAGRDASAPVPADGLRARA